MLGIYIFICVVVELREKVCGEQSRREILKREAEAVIPSESSCLYLIRDYIFTLKLCFFCMRAIGKETIHELKGRRSNQLVLFYFTLSSFTLPISR